MYQSLRFVSANFATANVALWQEPHDFELPLPVQDIHFSPLPSITTTSPTAEDY